jgi:hypothetical protein
VLIHSPCFAVRETIVTQVSVETVSEHELRSKVSSSGEPGFIDDREKY